MSSRVQTTAEIEVYEIDGDDSTAIERDEVKVIVNTHWNNVGMVRIQAGGKVLTVAADDLVLAIQRCSR